MGSDFFGAIVSIVERGFVAFIFVSSPTQYRPMEQAKSKSKSYWITQPLPVARSRLDEIAARVFGTAFAHLVETIK
jgi:hypothetical protein